MTFSFGHTDLGIISERPDEKYENGKDISLENLRVR